MRAAVLTQLNAPLELMEVGFGDQIRAGQVEVRISMAGICGSQLQEIKGEKGNAKHIPNCMGHEAVGIVEWIGDGVTTVKGGDKVVCHWMPGSGNQAHAASYLSVGKRIITGGPVHTFGTLLRLSENRVTAVPHDTPDDLCVLLGCALSTALGVCENEARLKMGESVLVVGCGGVGLCCIAAAKAMGTGILASYDLHEKGHLAVPLGATFHGPDDDQRIADNQFDCIIETTGNSAVIADTLPMLGPSGRYIMVGQPNPMANLMINNSRHLFDGTGKTIKATQGGGCVPQRDFPRWIHAWRNGTLKIDGIITHRIALADINQGLDILRSGQAGRVVIDMNL